MKSAASILKELQSKSQEAKSLSVFSKNQRKSMAPSMLLLLPALFFSLLLLMVPYYCIVDPTSTTLAIIQATGTVCGIAADSQHRTIQCTTFSELAQPTASFPIRPTLSFDSVSGGQNFLCSLRSGDTSFFCWDGINERIKRVYPGPTELSQLSVGSRHVAAINGDRKKIRWWRYGCDRHAQSCSHFPKSVSGEYDSLTSGDVFTCALNGTHSVHCWGPRAKSIQRRFAGMYMNSLTAGGGRMCGLNNTGHLICSGDQSIVPSGEAFEFTSLAIGSNQTCAIKRENGTVICWGRHGSYFPMGSTRFEFLVAGGDLTCGLTTDSFNVSCWGLNRRNLSAVILSLPKILPGVCVPDETSCSCGVYPDSWDLCGGSGIICKKSDTDTMESCQFSPVIIERPQAPSQTRWEKLHGLWVAFGIAGVVIFISCVIGFLCYLFDSCAAIENSTAPQDEADLLVPGNAVGPALPAMENVEVFTFRALKTATNNFRMSGLLGEGGFAKVFPGCLPNGQRVAVKRCNTEQASVGERMFRAELETVYRARHDNVISLIGYCAEDNERLIVFEFMSRKDLFGHLHPRFFQSRSLMFYSWKMRVKVLLDVAKGIRHLHYYTEPRIIHRDIKSANILIDENWNAKISDFGMAVFGPERGCEYVEVQTATGTYGYLDPDYVSNPRRATPAHDVYSFGVVMLEMITGRRAYNERNNTSLADTAAPRIRSGRLMEVLDNRVPPPAGRGREAIERVAHIAQRCLRAHLRGTMIPVVTDIEYALALFDLQAD